MQAELVLEPGDEVLQEVEDDTQTEQDQEECMQEKLESEEDQQHLVTTSTGEPTLVQSGGKLDSLSHTLKNDTLDYFEICYGYNFLNDYSFFSRSSAGIASDIR